MLASTLSRVVRKNVTRQFGSAVDGPLLKTAFYDLHKELGTPSFVITFFFYRDFEASSAESTHTKHKRIPDTVYAKESGSIGRHWPHNKRQGTRMQ